MRALQRFPLRRLTGALAVFALHVAIVIAFLSATQWSDHRIAQTGEVVLHLVLLQTPKPEAPPKPPKKTATPRATPIHSPAADFVVPPDPRSAPQTNGLARPFFDCSPAQLESATPRERAACASASLSPHVDPGEVDYRDHTDRSKSAALWARDRARKNAPLLLPCMSPDGFSPLYTAYCLGKSALGGKIDREDQPGYQDQPDHTANDGDTRMAPTPH
jgi:hypothetical protein